MEGTDQMLVSLDPSNGTDTLVKKVCGFYIENRVRDLLEYMLNPNGDILNPGYNHSERETVDQINGWMRESEVNRWYEFILVAALADGGILPLELDKVVKTYGDRILKRVQVSKENPLGVPHLDLYASFNEMGG